MRRFSLQLLLVFIIISSCTASPANNRGCLVFSVQITPKQRNVDELRIYLDWKTVSSRLKGVDKGNLLLTDFNNDKVLTHSLVDTDQNGTPEGVYFTIPFDRKIPFDGIEPIRSFCLKEEASGSKVNTLNAMPSYDSLTIIYLTRADAYFAAHVKPEKWSELFSNSILSTYPDPATLEIFSPGKWSYTNGFFLNALSELYKKNSNPEYLNYIKKWVGLFVDEKGNIDSLEYKKKLFELDNILPGRLLLFLFQQTGEEKYAKAAGQLLDQMNNQPRTSDGGFWHKKVYTRQMWLDGIYMGDVFLAQYGSVFNKPQYLDEAAKQIELIYKHTMDPKTGLLYHGWDESKNKIWANPETGTSPEFWGRALGWYMMALVDVLDYLPANHPQRDKILQILKSLSASLARYQDNATGLWYQVVDKGQLPGNWFESSCTAMFAYAFAKGYTKGYLGNEYLQNAEKAFRGLIDNEMYFDDQGKLYLAGTVKVGTLNFKVSKGDYNYYIGTNRRINDFKGISAFIYLAFVLENTKNLK
jgi:unsaturated rhamnogalacturonyl hydrolase